MNKIKYIFILFYLCISPFTAIGEENQSNIYIFKNTREGTSKYLNTWTNFWLSKREIQIGEDFFNNFSPKEQLCEENYYIKLKENQIEKKTDIKYALLQLRKENFLDDLALKNIFNFSELNFPFIFSINLENLQIEHFLQKFKNYENVDSFKQGLTQFSNYQKTNKCFQESFIQLFSALTKNQKQFKDKNKQFKKLIKYLERNKIINSETKKLLLMANKKQLQYASESLKTYKQKFDFIQKNTSNENLLNQNLIGISNFVSQKEKINKTIPRQRLYANYNQFQIIMMAQIIPNFLKRLDQTSLLGINLINEENEIFETIQIDSPMEIYRFLVKYMRFEIAKLKENHLFSNSNILYSDLIAAAFEMYEIPPIALEEVAKIEEIWNPQISKNEKIVAWVKMFTQVGIIFIPPPYNFMATLSILVIESFTSSKNSPASFDHSIFGGI